ncbi:MAG: M1 family metallopeptidase [Polyangiales bacterium]
MKRFAPMVLSMILASCAGDEPQPKAPVAPAAPSASAPTLGAVPEPPAEAPPLARLRGDARPTHYALELSIDPTKDRFSGQVTIEVELAHPKRVVWLHGRGLDVTEATITPKNGSPVRATWSQVHPSGVASLTFDQVVPAGAATIHLAWSAPFDRHGEGLYRIDRKSDHYAFTQFESLSARRAFPSFDEPVFKVPFDVTLIVPEGMAAIANTRETKRDKGRVTFATTAPLPTYLLAWAVGPLDVVDAPPIAANEMRKQPLPFRGVATRGRGKELAYALAHTPEIVKTLEGYFGERFPYDKLDIIAVPEKQGAMENAGAITYGEWLLLVDDKTATVWQKRAFASVSAHELAHHWFGDLVTMPWWDDIWLNEAFATWMGNRAHQTFQPASNAETSLVERVLFDAMGSDALVAARAIRQPIESEHDVYNAFDGITYQKGAGVLSMFERWVGKEVFRTGVRLYLSEHPNGNATSADLLDALSRVAKKDVATPFRTFLDRPGVPLLDVKLDCSPSPVLTVTQSRWFPLGSKGDRKQTWQLPMCARTPEGETCALLTKPEEKVALPGKCPAWVLPNADAAGYFRFAMPKENLAALLGKAWPKLSTRERLAVENAVHVGWSRGTAHADEIFASLGPLADDPYPSIGSAPMGYYSTARDWLHGTDAIPKVEAHARKLYAKAWASLGWDAKKNESAETTIRRANVAGFLAFTARDPAVRKEAAKRGHAYVAGGEVHADAVDPNLAAMVLTVAVQEDPALFDVVLGMLDKTDDEVVRSRLLAALTSVQDPKLAMRALGLTLDARLHTNEILTPLWSQMGQVETKELAWKFLLANFDAIVARVSSARAGALPGLAGRFCDEKHRAEAEAFFRPRLESLEGAPRNFSAALESLDLCVARRASQEAGLKAYFGKI